MSDMTFKANLIPDSNESYNIGSDSKKWKIYGRNYGTISHNKDLITKEYSDSNLNTAKNYSDNIITISTTQPTAENNKIWINDSEEGIIVEVPTIQEAIALGVSNANIGQGIKISTIDADGCPVAWSPANFIELSFSSADAGKIPVVNSNGQLVLMTKSEWENSLT